MADYYIETASGRKGPYPQEKIILGMQQGKVPTGAKLVNAATGEEIRAVDLTRTADSGSYTPAEPYQAQGQHQQQYRQPRRQPNYAQQQQQPYPQQQYPQQQQYAQPQYQQQYAQPQYGQQYPPPQYGQPYGAYSQPYYQDQGTSTLAIVSLVLSLISLLICGFLAIAGIICGILALKECQPNGPKKGRGLALGGIWTGVGVVVITTIAFLVILADSP